MDPQPTRSNPACDIAAWLLSGAALTAVLLLHLLPALIVGFLVYELVHILVPLLEKKLSTGRARVTAVALLAAAAAGAVAALIIVVLAFIRSDAGSIAGLMHKMAEIIDNSRSALPAWLVEKLPDDAGEARALFVDWLRHHAAAIQLAGKEAGHVIIQVLVGMIAGAMVSLHEACPFSEYKPLAAALAGRLHHFGEAFRRVVFAQVRISALNTAFTAVYLVVVLPLCGVHLPLTKTLIAVTFICGMLPVIGNLLSNAVIVIISLSSSLTVVVFSLVFLVVIHKLEYFLNARIVGSQIRAAAWEILVAMLVMESAFGLAGVVAAPIYYAFVKNELMARGLV